MKTFINEFIVEIFIQERTRGVVFNVGPWEGDVRIIEGDGPEKTEIINSGKRYMVLKYK